MTESNKTNNETLASVSGGLASNDTGKAVCSVCGYVYDPANHGGVAFDDLPEDWKCPRCKQFKEKFDKI